MLTVALNAVKIQSVLVELDCTFLVQPAFLSLI